MKRFLAQLLLAIAVCAMPAWTQNAADLKVELRSATGSNRFQVGEAIPLELVFSSTALGRYLEPCVFLNRSCSGYPVCRFPNKWKFSITPEGGWVDLDRPCGTMGGPIFIVKDHDLTAQPRIFPYELTTRFRFDTPGKYTVRFTIDIGLDDGSNPRPEMFKPRKESEQHSVVVSSELVLEIVPAASQWQMEIIRKGYEAYTRQAPQQANSPSPELLQYQNDTNGLCRLGTPEAARVLVEILLNGHSDVISCLERSPSVGAAIEEMERLLSEPDAAISPEFFRGLLILKNKDNWKTSGGHTVLGRSDEDYERERLLAALQTKRGKALSVSLLAVLQHPPRSKPTPGEFAYALPFSDSVIALTAANFDSLPNTSQKWLLTDGWDRIRSPLMLATVRRLARNGDGHALLRWQELDPAQAEAFEQAEVMRPEPRFSSFCLRLPHPLLPVEEKRLATNFVELSQRYEQSMPTTMHYDLVRLATLLHRYGTRAVLSTVLPAIDAHRSSWPCAVEYPVLAYLLKVSPDNAAPRVEEAVRSANHGPCNTSTFFTDLGFLEHGPVMEELAFAQLNDNPGPFARDAAEYLRSYAPPSAKERVWERLQYWQQHWASIAKSKEQQTLTEEQRRSQLIAGDLTRAFEKAQGWLLTPEDESRLSFLLGSGEIKSAACSFQCGGSLSVAGPGYFYIYGSETAGRVWNLAPIMDYLDNPNRLRYSIRQYGCPSMQALKEKLLQFPAGSTFGFAWDLSTRDRDELVEISDFLWSHGYKVGNWQKWGFLRADPPR